MSDYVLDGSAKEPGTFDNIRRGLKGQLNVLKALILHDIKSRYFGNGLGWGVTILWPAIHMTAIVLVAYFDNKPTSYGSSELLYAATGVLPYIAWLYIMRFCVMGQLTNRSFMSYPVVSILDTLFARVFIEVVTIFIVTIVLLVFLYAWEVDIMPVDIGQAFLGLLSAVLLGVGTAFLMGLLALIFPMVGFISIGLILFEHLASGLIFEPEQLPSKAANILWWNPLIHSVEWIRSAYYIDYPAHLLSKTYVLFFSFASISGGFLLERLIRKSARRAKR